MTPLPCGTNSSKMINPLPQMLLFLLAVFLVLSHGHSLRYPPHNYPPNYIPVYIMMPLDTVNNDGSLNNPSSLMTRLEKVKSARTDG